MGESNPIGYVYKTTNLLNGLIYIGQHKYTYKSNDKYYLGAGKKLKKAIKEFGSKNFKKEILKECYNQQQLDEMEQYYIALYNSTNESVGYNILNGGIRGFKMVMSEEAKIKISLAGKLRCGENHFLYGKNLPEEWRKEISNSMKGKIKTQEHREKLSKSMKGRFISDETKSKIRQARLGTTLKEETKLKISESMKRYKSLQKNQIQGETK